MCATAGKVIPSGVIAVLLLDHQQQVNRRFCLWG